MDKHSNLLDRFFKKNLQWFKKVSIFKLLLIMIFIIAIFFRFWNYNNRIFILADNSRDLQVAKYALDHYKIPQIGQFSSAGPFFYGPWYYWILMLFSLIPLGLLSPWYMMTILSIFFILLIYKLGIELGNKTTGILAAFFAAISPALISNSLAIWNPAIIPLLSLLILIFMVRYFKYRRELDIFLFGFFLTFSITIHFQSILLTPSILILLISTKSRLKHFAIFFLGMLIPMLPLIYFDVRHYWYNFKSIFIYLAIDQYSIWVPNRWLTYIFSYWPETWGRIIGGNRFIGSAIIIFVSIFTLANLKKFTSFKVFYLIALTFILDIILYRYYRGPRYEYYSFFTYPSIILLTAWACQKLFEAKKVIGFIFLIVVVFVTSKESTVNMRETVISLERMNSLKSEIYSSFPRGVNFDIYGCKENTGSLSQPLALLMYNEKRNESSGIKIGVCETVKKFEWSVLSRERILKDGWVNKTTSKVFDETAEWWKKNPPQKDNNFGQFLKRRLNPSCYPHCL